MLRVGTWDVFYSFVVVCLNPLDSMFLLFLLPVYYAVLVLAIAPCNIWCGMIISGFLCPLMWR